MLSSCGIAHFSEALNQSKRMKLLSYFRSGWNLQLGSQRLVINAPSEGAAFDLLATAADQLASSVANLLFKDALICWENCKRPIRVLAATINEPSSIATPEIPDIVLPRTLGVDTEELRLLERMRASEKPMPICYLETNDKQ